MDCASPATDRVRWLNGMVTNSMHLAHSQARAAYNFFLNAQGRIQGDLTTWAEADRLLLQTSATQVEPITDLLDRFIIMDDVELADLTPLSHGLLVAGPNAAEALSTLGIAARTSKLLKRRAVTWGDRPLILINAHGPVVPRFELWSANASDVHSLAAALEAAGVVACDDRGLDLLRILESTPRFGTDIRDRDLPQETAQTRALHFNKGCYLGQEIVERIRSRGAVHRTFTTFALIGTTPAPGAALLAEGKPVGELTSVASEPIDGRTLALGFIRREALERGVPITYEGGTAHAAAPQPAPTAS